MNGFLREERLNSRVTALPADPIQGPQVRFHELGAPEQRTTGPEFNANSYVSLKLPTAAFRRYTSRGKARACLRALFKKFYFIPRITCVCVYIYTHTFSLAKGTIDRNHSSRKQFNRVYGESHISSEYDAFFIILMCFIL